MKNTVNNAQDFTAMVIEKKQLLGILERLMSTLDNMTDDTMKEWRTTGEQEQATRWNDEHEKSMPVYLDENNKRTFEVTDTPLMVDCYDTLPKLELSNEDKATLSAIDKVRKALIALA